VFRLGQKQVDVLFEFVVSSGQVAVRQCKQTMSKIKDICVSIYCTSTPRLTTISPTAN